jgi:hypothetical protein
VQPQAEAVAETQTRTAGGPPLRYVAAGVLSLVALGLAIAIAVVAQPRRSRRTH